MTRTTEALQRFGITGLSAVILIGSPIAIQSAAAAGTPLLVANDCTQASTSTTTTTAANTATAPAPSNATGAGSGCTTQGQINTNVTLTFTYTEGGAPVAGRSLDFTLSNRAGTTANFPAGQPAGTSSNPGTAGVVAGQTAQCSTGTNGQCQVTVTDTVAEAGVTVTATERSTGTTANERVDFRTFSVAPARLDQVARVTVAPESSTAAGAPANATAPPAPSPGRPVQLTYQLTDSNGNCNNGLPAGTASNATTCTGTPLAATPVTLKVDQQAFFTPNCQLKDTNGTPQRATAGTATAPASTGTLSAPDYRGCSFTGTPTNGAPVTALTSQGQSLAVVTDLNGQFTVTVADGRDIGFDDDGNVAVSLTATASGVSVSPRNAGTGATTAPACATTPATAGCNAAPLVFTTRGMAVNGSTVAIVPVDGTTFAAGTNNVPTVQTRTFVLQVKDQYGNLTQGSGGAGESTGTARNDLSLVKTGQGDVVFCGRGTSTATNPCHGDDGPTNTTPENNGTTTDTFAGLRGSFTNLLEQERFQSDFGDTVGTQVLTATWIAPVTNYLVSPQPAAPAAPRTNLIDGFDQTKTSTQTDTVTLNFYVQQPTNITFDTTPASGTAAAGTVVTVSANVKDQFMQPVPNASVQFFRSGTSNNCTATASNGTGFGGGFQTNAAGRAGFSFACQDASTQNVTIIVSDSTGNELGRGLKTITFTSNGGTPNGGGTGDATFILGTHVIAAGQTTKVVVTGTPGDNVNLFVKGAGASVYTLLVTLHPNASGVAAQTVSPGTNSTYYIQNAKGSSATQSLQVKAVLTIVPKVTGRTVTFSGHVAPSVIGRTVTIYYTVGGGHVQKAASGTVGKGGNYHITHTFTSAQTISAFAETSTDSKNFAGRSSTKTVAIH